MRSSQWKAVLDAVTGSALRYLESLEDRDVYRPVDPDEIRSVVGGALPEGGTAPERVVAELAERLEPYIAAHASGRYFGFVIGGLHPAAYGADLLCSTWDQNAALGGITPGVVVIEEVAAGWILDLLDLPEDASVGFVTGGQMATFTCLAAARDQVLREVGWDVEARGLQGAPHVNVVVKSEQHATVGRALRYLGLGDASAVQVPSDGESRIGPDALRAALSELHGPTIVCAEAGNVNTGAFDPFEAVADAADEHRARGNPCWVHVDGAFGLWARASGEHRPLTHGLQRCDSWSTDAHKLLCVPYDSGIAVSRHRAPHRAAMGVHASYLVHAGEEVRDPLDWTPEFSRRARGLAVYAALRSLGRRGVEDLVDGACAMARRFAEQLSDHESAEVVNEVAFNQVLVRWRSPDGDEDAFTDRVIERIQRDGTAYFSGTTWQGRRLMRISVSDWATDKDDVDRAVAALLRCAELG